VGNRQRLEGVRCRSALFAVPVAAWLSLSNRFEELACVLMGTDGVGKAPNSPQIVNDIVALLTSKLATIAIVSMIAASYTLSTWM
jgi:hypothetical protein